MSKDGLKWNGITLVQSGTAESVGEEALFAGLVDDAKNSDAFILIPMVINDNGNGTFSVDTSVQMHDRLNLDDNSVELEAVYLSALGGLLGSCFNRLEPKAVVEYLSSLLQRFMDMEKTQQRH